MSEQKKSNDAEEILSEFQSHHSSNESTLESSKPVETKDTTLEVETNSASDNTKETNSVPDTHPKTEEESAPHERNVIFVGTKPIMTYVTATLTQLASQPTVTIKARGKRITQAVDVSQMIVKRMDTVGYRITDVRISSDSLTSQDGKQRNVSTMEIDITKA